MFEQDVVKPGYILGYILSLLALSWLVLALTVLGLIPPLSLTVIPFIPGILALLFLSLEGHPIEVHARPLLRPVTVPSVTLAVAYPLLLVGLAALVALGSGLGYLNSVGGTGTGILAGCIAGVAAFLTAIPASLGQEYGYRGYLLPALTYWQGRVAATITVGITWGLAIAPVSSAVLLASGTGDGTSMAILGFLLTVAVAFAFSSCYYLSESLLSVVLMNILLLMAVPAFFATTWDPTGTGPGGLIRVTWPSPLPLLLLVALAFVPVFAWIFTAMDGEIDGDAL
jgi:membrane protease YdiL (CAAX protease family)